MRLTLSQIAGIAALVSALQYGQAFGQTPNILELRDAAKDAFNSTSKAFEKIEKDQEKAKPAGAKKGATASKTTKTKQSKSSKGFTAKDESSDTMFSKIAGRATRAETAGPSSSRLAAEEQEKKFLSFLGTSSDTIYRVALSIVGVAFAILVGLRIKEKVKDVTSGRPSLSRSRIIRR